MTGCNLCETCHYNGGVFNGYALCNAPDASKLMDAPMETCKHFVKNTVDK